MVNHTSTRLKHYDYRAPGAYFVTLTCLNRQPLFGAIDNGILLPSPLAKWTAAAWAALPQRYAGLRLDSLILMPDHLHGIILFERPMACSLTQIINLFKGRVTQHAGRKVWQRSFWERVIRNEQELRQVREYIETNPLRWMLKRAGQDG